LSEIYRGVVVPMITPFTPAGEIDEPAVGRIVDVLVGGGVNVFPLGTTGESASIPSDDKRRAVDATVRGANGRCAVYAGYRRQLFSRVGPSWPSRSSSSGASRLSSRTYRRITSSATKRSNRTSSGWPTASRCRWCCTTSPRPRTTRSPSTSSTGLSRHDNIVAIKDSSGDKPRLTEMLKRTGGRGGFPVLLGSSASFSHGLRAGAVGLVPSGGHLVPREYQQMYEAAMADRWDDVERFQHETDAVCAQYLRGRSLAQGLGALKAILESRGVCGRTMLPPLKDHVGTV
jgi:4-hydroxy-tetrahydrodipicolinate synthase